MIRKQHLGLIAVLLAVSVGVSGCPSMFNGSVTHKVVASQHTFKEAVAAFQTAEIAEHDKGFVPDALHLQMQTVIQKVALSGVDLDTALASNAPSSTLKIKLTSISALLNSISTQGILPIQNANTKAILGIALNQVSAIIDLALTQVQ